ncbi:MAG: hypothetical protein ABI741_06055 [Ferruginibacter sp.]
MFKRTVAILFITLFVLTQYGRQAAYLQCKIENFTSKSNTATCDCEKNNGNDLAKYDNKLPAPKTHVHISFDDYYVLNENSYYLIINDQPITFSNRPISFLSSFNGNISHPPQL